VSAVPVTAMHIVDWLWLIIPLVLLTVLLGLYAWLRTPLEPDDPVGDADLPSGGGSPGTG